MYERYFGMLGKRRKRYRRARHVRGPPSLEEPLLAYVDDQADGPHEYTLVKERKPRSAPTKTKRPKKQGVDRRAGHRGVGRRMIIDIHLEVLDECQKGDLHSTKEDFFEILVQEFMGSNFIQEKMFPKDDVPKEQGRKTLFLRRMFLRRMFLRNRFQVKIPGLGKDDFVPKENVPKENVPKEQVPS
ncbi:SICA antigen [Plasmodium coatneyi]|uniref:SICA antigen n=1 Tax=Plasmodium coatneyi TaxID=208452 RepID=A0A1B1E2D2_9APIC|nr:SICA antigen [Plasmodium coatneyi]ANQ09057.1 SICA antigen [Plasmodium coatneyi]